MRSRIRLRNCVWICVVLLVAGCDLFGIRAIEEGFGRAYVYPISEEDAVDSLRSSIDEEFELRFVSQVEPYDDGPAKGSFQIDIVEKERSHKVAICVIKTVADAGSQMLWGYFFRVDDSKMPSFAKDRVNTVLQRARGKARHVAKPLPKYWSAKPKPGRCMGLGDTVVPLE